tara:strand:+ start:8849 stop:10312 length:1464 start_codon:yes stop_codon:yes gene_type:complete
MKRKAIIIGSGISGLALAVRLKSRGFDVHVYEKNKSIGGKLSDFHMDNFRHDFGPKLFTMPNLLEDIFNDANLEINEYIKYRKLDIACKYFWDDGTEINAFSDRKKFINELNDKLSVDESKLNSYLERSERKFKLVHKIFLERSLHKFSTFFSIESIIATINFFKLDIFTSLNSLNKKYFKNQKLIQLFNRFATYNGSSPYLTSGIMSIIQHLEHDLGVYMPENGISSISKCLHRLAIDTGVKFHLNCQIHEIIINNNCAIGIKTSNSTEYADYVISNMDVSLTYEKLLKDYKKPYYVKKYQPSSSAVVFYWNMDKSFENLNIHNIIFSKDQRKEFDFIFNKKLISDDPTVYICSTSKMVKNDAPKGCENWFILINSPFDSGQDWEIVKNDLRKNVIRKIEKTINIKIERHILKEKILTPIDIELETMSKFGSLYGSSSNSIKSAFLRHPNFSKKIKNLYFCGGSVHPGGGIPLCLNSAKIVSDLID